MTHMFPFFSVDEELSVDDAIALFVEVYRETFTTVEEIDPNSMTYNPAEGTAQPVLTHKHQVKVDKAMELWAQAQCGVITVSIS